MMIKYDEQPRMSTRASANVHETDRDIAFLPTGSFSIAS